MDDDERRAALEWRPSLDVVRQRAEDLRKLRERHRAQLDEAQEIYANALREALRSHTKHEVAQAAGVSYQAVYRAIKQR